MNEWQSNKGETRFAPVPFGTLIDFMHRDGEVFIAHVVGESGYCSDWSIDVDKEHPGDIVKWRVSE